MTTGVAQRITKFNKDEEVTKKVTLLDKAIEQNLITLEAFNLYLGAQLQDYVYETISENDLKALYKELHTKANEDLKTTFKIPRYTMYSNRLKRCAHCNDLYFDLSAKNQTSCCMKKIAFSNNKIMTRNGVLLSECYREYSAKQRRKTNEDRSIGEYKEVAIDSFYSVMDSEGNIVTDGKRRPQDESTSLPIFDSVRGIFDEYWNIKDQEKYDALDDYTKAAVTPSNVTIYTIEEYNEKFNTNDQSKGGV